MVEQRFNKVRPYSAQPAILPKPEFTLDRTEEALKILMYPHESILGKTCFQLKSRSKRVQRQ